MKYKIRKQYRLQGWNYQTPGYYFVTICTKNRRHYLGEIKNEKLVLNKIGLYAKKCWRDIPNHFKHACIDSFVIMPNHIHGIVRILELRNVGTQNFVFLPNANDHQYKNKIGPQSKTLGSIIRGFKIGVTKFTRQNNIHFGWQPRFNDRIIRNENELHRVREYIKHNPMMWARDRNNI